MSHPQPSVETESPDPQATGSRKGQAKPAQIVDWVPETGLNAPRKTAPRLYHKKSRTGCQHCRTRRVKCDEVHPVCGSCLRHHAACVWDRTDVPGRSQTYEIRTKASSNPEASSLKQEKIVLPESKDRRLLELQLLHHYTADTASTINVQTDPNRHIWAKTVPRVAFTNSALLYSIYTLAALHLANLDRKNVDHVLTYQRYLGLTLQEHRKDVANLGNNNADTAVLTSTLLRLCNFALLQERSYDPYTPPKQWLHMSSTVGRGLSVEAWKYIQNDESSVLWSLIQAAPGVTTNDQLRDDDLLFQESNRSELLYLLRRTQANIETEPWDPDIQEAYETTLSYIGSIHLAIKADELPESIFRRIVLFPMMVKLGFVALVEGRQPRALVVLTHYFSLLTGFSHFWWIGETGSNEVRGIKSVLAEEWLDLMYAPLKAIADQTGAV